MKNFSSRDLAEAKKLLTEKKILQVLFSEGTYQIEVMVLKKPKKTLWPFLQITDSGEVIDAFCTCAAAEKKGTCPHLAAAYLKIMEEEPLHVRFRESLWNQVGFICFQRHGSDPKCIQISKEKYETFSESKQLLFSLQPLKEKVKKQLEDLFFYRPVETEETSLKFSNLSLEELTLWREGRPSEHFCYELSFWSDLAKWWMLLQEENVKYSLHFSEEAPPHFLQVHLDDMVFSFYIDLAHWPQIIPTLDKVVSPLKVYPTSFGKVKKISFSRETSEFFLEFEEKTQKLELPKKERIQVGEWLYYTEEGFYPKERDPLLQKNKIEKNEVNDFLTRHRRWLGKHLTQEKIHPHPVPLQYEIFFDENHNLNIDAYVFEKGDLNQTQAHYFGDFVYLPDKGFFPLEEQHFAEKSLAIDKNKVSEFVNRHRVWLQNYEGFQTHVSGVESHLGFKLNEMGHLIFFTRLEFTEEEEHIIDLGEWIYVGGKGFYAKVTTRVGAFVKPGMEIEPIEISSFIHKHKEELEPIPGFFAEQCPLEKTGLNIGFNEERQIVITPEFFFASGYVPNKVEIFGDYTYVENEGFSLIPLQLRLPESYKAQKVVDSMAEPYFVGYELELLYPHVLTLDPRLKRPQKIQLRLKSLKREPKAKTGQWIVEFFFETDIGTVSLHRIWEGIWQMRPYLFTEAGLIFLRDRRFDWLREKSKKRWLQKGASLRLTTLEFLRLSAFETILPIEEDTKKGRETRELFSQFLEFKAPTEIDLEGLKSHLRLYQKIGVDWLWFLYSYELSGLLCDEMGLGKTHQAMALIAGIKNAQKEKRPKILVVCPTSVIYHWEKLIQNFIPSVKPYIFHGLGREFKAFSEDSYDLLLTSYGIVRTENQALSSFHFDLAIFDELQVAKNEKSLTHKALRNISAKMRLGLTGTPIENRLLELKALFDLVIPSYLPTLSIFRELFVNPIEKYHDEKKQQLLKRLVRPFLLRRKKSEVLTELPEKIEEVVLCDLSAEQQTLYQEIIAANREALLKDLKDANRPQSMAHVFSLLSKLKQVCDHPCLINKDKKNYKKYTSGKWELFLELFHETRDSGQKLVIFSQYLDMLDIMKMYLKEEKIEFAEIRGATQDRKNQVKRFSEDPKCEVFLGSIQAAGVGIDLIAASVVIHYDRMWNPAKENQATDRVHRMGQKRGVQVFKLVTKNTIEEHIHTLIEKKQALAKKVLGFDAQDQIKGLQREELIELLQFGYGNK